MTGQSLARNAFFMAFNGGIAAIGACAGFCARA